MRWSAIRSVLLSVLTTMTLVLAPTAAAAPSPASTTADAAADGRPGPRALDLSVVTYNIHHAQGADGVLDLDRVAEVLRDSGADVIGLQEVDRHWGERSDNLDQAAELAERLDMHAVYGANLDLAPASPGEPRRQYGTAILSKYPIEKWSNTLLPKLPAGEQRGLLAATVLLGDTPVRILNTHLQHNNTPERLSQIAAIEELTAGCGQATVLTGDMNARPDTTEYDQLTDTFTDVWPLVGQGPGYTFDSDDPQGRIDYVLLDNGTRAVAAEVLQTLASDHMPVSTELWVPRRPGSPQDPSC